MWQRPASSLDESGVRDGDRIEGVTVNDDMNRRALFRRAGRYVGACALAGVTAYLGLRSARRGTFFSGSVSPVCRGCEALESCSLPQAERTRHALAERSDVRLARRTVNRDKTACPYRREAAENARKTKSHGSEDGHART